MYPGSQVVSVSRVEKLNMIYFEDIWDPLCVSSVYSTVECVPSVYSRMCIQQACISSSIHIMGLSCLQCMCMHGTCIQ